MQAGWDAPETTSDVASSQTNSAEPFQGPG